MRLAWVTPLAAPSGISRYSLNVVAALAERDGVEIDLWAPRLEDEIALAVPGVRLLRLDGARSDAELSSADEVVYNLGNHAPFHREIHEASTRVPGTVVYHDKFMHEFFAAYWLRERRSWRSYLGLMTWCYGERGHEFASAALRGDVQFSSPEAHAFPLLEPSLAFATAAIVHSEDARRIVTGAYGDLLPVAKLALAPTSAGYERAREPRDPSTLLEAGIPDDAFVIVTPGHVAPHKRVESLIRSFARVPALREDGLLLVVGGGSAEYLDSLRTLAAAEGVASRVRFTGFVADEALDAYIARADVCAILRYPSTESASGPLVDSLFFGKPLVVTDIGYYAELPDDVAVRIGVEHEIDDLAAALSRLHEDAPYRSDLGRNARLFAEEHHDPAIYAERLLSFLAETREVRARLRDADDTGAAGEVALPR